MNLRKENDGIVSVNNELYDDVFVNELESRLETDPLMANGLLNLVSTVDATSDDVDLLCWFCDSESDFL